MRRWRFSSASSAWHGSLISMSTQYIRERTRLATPVGTYSCNTQPLWLQFYTADLIFITPDQRDPWTSFVYYLKAKTMIEKSYLAFFLDKSDAGIYQPLHKSFQILIVVLHEDLRQGIQPGLHDGSPAQGCGFQIDHTTSAHCGWLWETQ